METFFKGQKVTKAFIGGQEVKSIWKAGVCIFESPLSIADNFILLAGITDNNQKIAINYLIDNLINEGLWDKFKVIYPIVGGTAKAHKINIKDMTSDANNYWLNFDSNVVHSVNGINNGVSDTVLKQSNSDFNGNINEIGLFFFVSSGSVSDFRDIETWYSNIKIRTTADLLEYTIQSPTIGSVGNTSTRGFYNIISVANNNTSVYKDSSLVGASNLAKWYGWVNPFSFGYNDKVFSFFAITTTGISNPFTSMDLYKLNNIIQTYQSMLDR